MQPPWAPAAGSTRLGSVSLLVDGVRGGLGVEHRRYMALFLCFSSLALPFPSAPAGGSLASALGTLWCEPVSPSERSQLALLHHREMSPLLGVSIGRHELGDFKRPTQTQG